MTTSKLCELPGLVVRVLRAGALVG